MIAVVPSVVPSERMDLGYVEQAQPFLPESPPDLRTSLSPSVPSHGVCEASVSQGLSPAGGLPPSLQQMPPLTHCLCLPSFPAP